LTKILISYIQCQPKTSDTVYSPYNIWSINSTLNVDVSTNFKFFKKKKRTPDGVINQQTDNLPGQSHNFYIATLSSELIIILCFLVKRDKNLNLLYTLLQLYMCNEPNTTACGNIVLRPKASRTFHSYGNITIACEELQI
jgi:hypothetical protein